jgi:HK97 gp10 family phage protein
MEVTGLKELNKRLTKLPERIERNIMSAAVRAGANEIKKAAVANLGGKKSDIVVKKSRAPKGTTKYKIGPKKDKFYYYFLEFGTYMSFIGDYVRPPKWRKKGRAPQGIRANPFMRPAFDEAAPKAISAMKKKIIQRLEKEARK